MNILRSALQMIQHKIAQSPEARIQTGRTPIRLYRNQIHIAGKNKTFFKRGSINGTAGDISSEI